MLLRPLASALAVALLALGGCAGKDGGGATAPAAPASLAHPHGLLPPTLKVGDWWNFTAPGGALSYVVAADGGGDYTMDTDNDGLAFFDARSDVSTLGPIRKSDLAGSQGQDRVQFFQWPLSDGKNWTTSWDGLPVTISAKVDGEVAQMTARRANGTLYATYAYSNQTRWFTALDFKDARGESAFALKLQSSGHGFSGQLRRYSLDAVVDWKGALANDRSTTYDVDPTVSDVYGILRLDCSVGAYSLAGGPLPTGPAENRGFASSGACPAAIQVDRVLSGPPAQKETWGTQVTGVPGSMGAYSVQVWKRHLALFAAGQAP